ncbi:DUF397 domain-containing protein [Streptomyces niveiscabiei]|uniref:DUF397 domain-containing protein n=1 Tax=Streptomyces niveiscabiei TaxID=164115 RepID=UPI0029B2A3A0|nr:DUF397 domain-containing protein [Streptomyces niveiscabiei]MDX3387876.1 DUF397 domain-containing protein [Streptomyces niveiscabiei]
MTTNSRRRSTALDFEGAPWRKSSYSGTNSQCVEIADLSTAIALRDSKAPEGPALLLTPTAFARFIARL